MFFNQFDICMAWYLYASQYHGGQNSKLYRVFARLEKVGFRAGSIPDLSHPEWENVKEIYQSLVDRKVYQ